MGWVRNIYINRNISISVSTSISISIPISLSISINLYRHRYRYRFNPAAPDELAMGADAPSEEDGAGGEKG